MTKQTTLFILIILSAQTMLAQQWFETGDVWVQREYNGLSGYQGYEEVVVIGDTIVDNLPAKVLDVYNKGVSVAFGGSQTERRYRRVVREENNAVYHWDGEEFDLIYDFNLSQGDTMTYMVADSFFECEDSVNYILDTIYTIVFGSELLTVQEFHYYDTYWDYTGYHTVIEKIGLVEGHFVLPLSFACYTDATGYGLCSFRSGVDSLLFMDEPCYDLPSSTDNLIEDLVSISPNPAKESILIDGHQKGFNYSMISMDGSVRQINLVNNSVTLDELPRGVYTLLIKNEKGVLVSTEKLVVMY